MNARILLALWMLVASSAGCARAPRETPPAPAVPRLTFVPESDSFRAAAAEYTSIWEKEGARIVRAMESVSGLTFEDSSITAIVYEGVSRSGFRERPMRMRASYPSATKRATLIHELGHRLQSPLFKAREEEHGELFLWLYDVWVQLYGVEFADAQAGIERQRGGVYPAAWDQALALTPAERAERWREVISSRRR
jgi:hypothetical protein